MLVESTFDRSSSNV